MQATNHGKSAIRIYDENVVNGEELLATIPPGATKTFLVLVPSVTTFRLRVANAKGQTISDVVRDRDEVERSLVQNIWVLPLD